ncbi:PqqD family protein [Francisella tularensis subsp. novicida]|uniref:PqqD family peptide modification chaperone n=1 Tax=Francisella tularensis TaxID=263 RepID=UPI00020BCEBA|nr:PqqD family peptide modification chaperone [Francisella tularensis]AEE87353.1 hypothetical protein FNFX1_0967 [Francisella cf. novicida Fx1]AVC44284.1 PqqD family protein [Francisella tularensis subsp. novicida]
MSKINLNDKITRNNDFYSSEIDNELIMMDISNNNFYTTGEIGNRIWELLEFETSCENICQQLCQEYDVSVEQCQQDTLNFLDQLLENKAIQLKK